VRLKSWLIAINTAGDGGRFRLGQRGQRVQLRPHDDVHAETQGDLTCRSFCHPLAAANKCLAQNSKSRMGANATTERAVFAALRPPQTEGKCREYLTEAAGDRGSFDRYDYGHFGACTGGRRRAQSRRKQAIRRPTAMKALANMMRKLFPSTLVKELIRDLDAMTPLFDWAVIRAIFPDAHETNKSIASAMARAACGEDVYGNIKARLSKQLLQRQDIAQQAREHESWRGVRAYNLCGIVHMSHADVACGHYHVYRGILSFHGEAYKSICTTAAKELITMGVWNADSMRRLSEDLDECIRNAG
jgi:hypothetical protein